MAKLVIQTYTTGIANITKPEAIIQVTTNQEGIGRIPNGILQRKGDIIAASSASTPTRVQSGENGTFLRADSTATAGVSFSDPGYNARIIALESALEALTTRVTALEEAEIPPEQEEQTP